MGDSLYRIKTPEGITFTVPLAGVSVRCFSAILDLLIISACNGALMIPLNALRLLSADFLGFAAIITQFVVGVGYAIATEWFLNGQTYGKRIFGIRVMDAQGLPLRFHQILLRNIVRPIDMLPVFYLTGAISCVVSRYAQRLGDIAAGTIVIVAKKEPAGEVKGLSIAKYNTLWAAPHIVARLRQSVPAGLAAIGLEALSRAREFEPGARLELFAAIAASLRKAGEIPPEYCEGIPDEAVVANVVQAIYASRLARPSP